MIKIENVSVHGFEEAIRGMRNPMNSWDKSDSYYTHIEDVEAPTVAINGQFHVGDNDLDLMKRLVKAGTDHRKFMRMITVYADITAPLYWWKEADTYKVGTVRNSCSTMHKITEKEFTFDDFSHEQLIIFYDKNFLGDEIVYNCELWFNTTKNQLNLLRKKYLETNDKRFWYSIIQLLPSSYNQRATLMLNYEVLANMYHSRKAHKLDEWVGFCKWIETLPYSELITGGEVDASDNITE